MFEFPIFFNRADNFQHFFVRQSRDEIDAGFLKTGDNGRRRELRFLIFHGCLVGMF